MQPTPIDVRASQHSFDNLAGYQQEYGPLFIWKNPDDLRRYGKILAETKPDLLIETGTRWGGFACWVADRGVDVVTVDVIGPDRAACEHPRVTVVTGNSVDRVVVDRVAALAAGYSRVMVSLDSDHHQGHVLAELNQYAQLVTPGCYLVCEDALADLVEPDEARRFGARIPEEGGPLRALDRWIGAQSVSDWRRDLQVEGMTRVSHSPYGWWRRVS